MTARWFFTRVGDVAESRLRPGRDRLALAAAKLADAQRNGAAKGRENGRPLRRQHAPGNRADQEMGVTTLRGIAAALNARGVPTARGGTWTPVQIMAIERRA